MGFGRVKVSLTSLACLAAFGVGLLALAGCGSDQHENLPRPPIAAGISVDVTADRVSLSPGRVGFEPVSRQQIIEDERDGEIQAPSDQPLPVKLTIANTTDRPLKLVLVGPTRRVSPEVTATGTAVMTTRLPTGTYRVGVADGDARTARLVVGPDRSSPQNDLLLP